MDPLTGAVIAAAVAVISIVIAIKVPSKLLPVGKLRPVGGISLALLGLTGLGVPLPSWLPTAILVGGIAAIMAYSAMKEAKDQADAPEGLRSERRA